MYLHVICKTWRWLPVCFYIIATPPTLFDGTHVRRLAGRYGWLAGHQAGPGDGATHDKGAASQFHGRCPD